MRDSLSKSPERPVVAVSTLDTKGRETAYLARRIREGGLELLVVDCGVFGEPLGITPDISHERVAEAAARRAVPPVVFPGGVDFFVVGPRESVPPAWRGQPQYHHNPAFTLIRASRDEMALVGRIMAGKLRASRGPVVVGVPIGGSTIPLAARARRPSRDRQRGNPA